jgi:hypothetical protein
MSLNAASLSRTTPWSAAGNHWKVFSAAEAVVAVVVFLVAGQSILMVAAA